MPNETQYAATDARPRRRIWWFWVIASLLLLVFAGVHLIGRSRVESHLAAIRKAGFPASPEELNAWYSAVPPAENAAFGFIEAADLVEAPTAASQLPVVGKAELPEPGATLSPEMREAMSLYLAANKDALETIRSAAQLPKSRYTMDLRQGFSTLLPHLAQLKKLAQLLKLETIYASDRRQPDLAVRSTLDALALAHSLANEPLVISELVRMACVAITVSGLERTLSENALTDQQLRTLSEKLQQAEADGHAGLTRALAGERSVGIDAFSMPPAKMAALSGSGGSSDPPQMAFVALRVTGIQGRDFGFYLNTMEQFIKAAQMQFPDALQKARTATTTMEERFQTVSGRLLIFSRMLLPALTKSIEKEARMAAQLRSAQLAIAIERYRIARGGGLPSNLGELMPTYLDQMPSDPFDGQPLRLERLDKGYRVLCPGASEDSSAPTDKKGRKKPLVFVVAR